jgi:hypothetical protein
MATSTLGSGTLVLAGTTSGTTTVTATAVAGTTTLTLPAATDTLVGRATTDTLTNKTLTSPTITGTLTTTGNTILGDASTDTLNVGNGDLVKDAVGNLGIGTSSITANLQIQRTTPSFWMVETTSGTSQRVEHTVSSVGAYNQNLNWNSGSASRAFTWSQGGTENMRIDSSGNLLVGTTTAIAGAARLAVLFAGNATDGIHIQDSTTTSGAVFQAFSNSSGTSIGNIARVTTTNAVVYNTTSDYRLKTVIGAVTGQGARIDALKPVDYLWTEGGQQARGFLAHEFQAVYSSSVTGDKDAVDAEGKPVYQAMQASTPEVIADLVAEIQSLRKRLAAAGI